MTPLKTNKNELRTFGLTMAGAKSYWIPTEKDGPWTRPDKPY